MRACENDAEIILPAGVNAGLTNPENGCPFLSGAGEAGISGGKDQHGFRKILALPIMVNLQ